MTDLGTLLAQGERQLQAWLQAGPPPVHVVRQVHRPEGAEHDRAWAGILERIGGGPPGPASLVDVVRVPHDATAGRVDELAFAAALATVREAKASFRLAVELAARADPADPRRAAAVEGYAFALAEESVGWARTIAPDLRLRADAPEFVAALEAARAAAELASPRTDPFRAHRATWNLGRVLQDLGYPPAEVRAALEHSLRALDFAVGVRPATLDACWERRREDLLHRLVLACAADPSPDAALGFMVATQELKDAGDARRAAARAAAQGRDVASMVLAVTALKDGREVAVPMVLDVVEMARRLPPRTGVLQYVLTGSDVVVQLMCGAGSRVARFKRDGPLLGVLDLLLRPGAMDFYGTTGPRLEAQAEQAVYALDLSSFRPRAAEPPLQWEMVFESAEYFSGPDGAWQVSTGHQSVRLDAGIAWPQRLGRLLVEPLLERFPTGGMDHVVVVPDMALSLLPFHLLEVGGAPLHDRCRVSYAASPAILACALSRPAAAEPDGPVLVVSDPSGTLACADWEVEAVRRAALGPVVVLDRRSASRENVLAAMKDASVVHFCTHGRFRSDAPEESGLLLKGGQWLTFDDIARAELRAHTVFLSACRTGRVHLSSRVRSAGLPGRFLAAGARAVVSALWEVDDVAAALLAAAYHAPRAATPPTSRVDRLHEAMSSVRDLSRDDAGRRLGPALAARLPPGERPFGHPFHWGAWCLHGAWD